MSSLFGVVLALMLSRFKQNLIKYFFFGNSITNDGYLRLVYLLLRFLAFLPLSLCATVVLGIYSLRRPVKIFILRCDRSKVSFIVEDLEVALRIEAHNNKASSSQPALMFAVLDCESPNRAFTAMYARVLPFLDDYRQFLRGVVRYVLPIFCVNRAYLATRQTENQLTVWSKYPPTLSFLPPEEQDGKDLQEALFLIREKPFVCVGIAEPIYYHLKHQTEHQEATEIDLYSCMPSWKNYFDATQKLSEIGVASVRMGQYLSKDLPEISKSMLIDYASTMRTEFGDVWLFANCKFVIAGGTGLFWISSAFNRPTVLTDLYSLSNTTYGINDIVTPQLAWSRSNKKLMSLSWLITQGEGWGHKRSLIGGDIEIIKNTSEEITEVVLEMNQRLDGTWVESDEDIELQRQFRQLREVVPRWRVQQSVRIGADFLRRYKHLL